ncbi:MAG TPA: FtsX-like permease family protein, partial [Dehalococcoidia bacterium]
MKELFGIPMDTIMVVLLAIFAVSLASVALIFVRSGVMFRMGLRNIPRRGLQSGLVIVGLMLATLITTAAFTTGDTIDHSITNAGYESLQRVDLSLNLLGEDTVVSGTAPVYFSDGVTAGLEREFANDSEIAGFIPLLQEPVPAINQRSRQSEPSVTLSGIDPQRMTALGSFRLVDGGKADLSMLGPSDIYLSKQAAEKLSARVGDQITLHAGGSSAVVTVVGIIKDEAAVSGITAFYEKGSGGGAMLLSSVQKLSGHTGELNTLAISLTGGLTASRERSDAAIARLEPFLQSDAGRQLLGVNNPVSVAPVKADAIDEAVEFGNLFVAFFLLLGLFSIAAGIMLIFMIFVMLATERKPEMGMARAVGAQRSSLIQAFVSEGMAYTLIAGAVGALVGVAAAIALVVGFLRLSGGFDFIEAHITVRSLVISYCLGVVVTFLTVVFSAMQVSSVNIVAAIRGTEEDPRRNEKRRISWRWMLAGLPAMIVPPLGIWFFFRKGLGIAWAWILAPIGIALGLLSIMAANSSESEFLFSFGVSVLPLSFALIASRLRAPARLTWTLVGAYLAAYWLAPVDYARLILGKHLSGDIEMFVLSGVMVVIASTLIIVYNARLLTVIFQRGSGPRYAATAVLAALTVASFAGGYAMGDRYDGTGQLLYLFGGVLAIGTAVAFAAVRFPHLAPALKMGVAYPLANRFRTGMAIAMFSLIVFSLATFGAVNASFVSMLTADGGDGGWDAIVTANRNTEEPNLAKALAEANAPVTADVAAIGRTTVFDGDSQVRVPGNDYKAFPVLAADETFFTMQDARLGSWARGYEDEASVFGAVALDSNLALVDPSVLPSGFNDYEFQVKDLTVEDDRFDPFDLEYTDVLTGREARVTVIGVLAIQVPPQYTAGVYVNQAAYKATFGEPDYLRSYVRFNDGVKVKAASESIEAALLTQGVQAETTKSLLDASVQESNTFVRMFQ